MALYLHVDMDCFFCACEEKRDHLLKGRPVIVGSTGQRGVVSTANYEARKYDVHSALPISTARKRCPEGIFLAVDGPFYREESRRVMRILESFDPSFVQVSVDEAYLQITRASIAEKVQQRIKKETGLSCSIGVADCRNVAKIASDYKKPGGITIVLDRREFLEPLAIEKIPGVGKKTLPWYHRQGVYVVRDLLRFDRFELLEHFGEQGLRIVQMMLGEISYGMPEHAPAKSVSRERTFETDCSNVYIMQTTLKKLCSMVHEDLEGMFFKTVSIKVRYKDFTTHTRDHTLLTPIGSKEMLLRQVRALFSQLPQEDIRLLGVKVSGLSSGQSMLEEFMQDDVLVH